jgi:hypothetical protein
MQNVKYDCLTGKVYEELGCPSKSTSKTGDSDAINLFTDVTYDCS